MSQSKINTLLNKVKALLEGEGQISKLEKDLVKSYLREVYELTDTMEEKQAYIPKPPQTNGIHSSEEDKPIKTTEPEVKRFPKAFKEEPSKESGLQQDPGAPEPELDSQEETTSSMERTPEPDPAPAKKNEGTVSRTAETFEKLPEDSKQHSDVRPDVQDTISADKTDSDNAEDLPRVKQPTATPQQHQYSDMETRYEGRSYGYSTDRQQDVQEVMRGKADIPGRYKPLFPVASGGGELSDRLSRSPIKDLRKAFAINERMLVINDLFGGNYEKFNETLDILNTKYSFEEAKSYIIRHLIDTYQWLDEEKSEQAIEFIKLVERRYLE